MKPWDYVSNAHDSSYKYGKLGLRVKKCIFIKMFKHLKGVGKWKYITEFELRDAMFLDNGFF